MHSAISTLTIGVRVFSPHVTGCACPLMAILFVISVTKFYFLAWCTDVLKSFIHFPWILTSFE